MRSGYKDFALNKETLFAKLTLTSTKRIVRITCVYLLLQVYAKKCSGVTFPAVSEGVVPIQDVTTGADAPRPITHATCKIDNLKIRLCRYIAMCPTTYNTIYQTII